MNNPKIIAIDFDGCLFEEIGWPKIGRPNIAAIHRAKEEKAKGAVLILYTCRSGQELNDAILACADYDLFFDLVNENPPWIIAQWGGDTRKIVADEYWDNHAVNVSYENYPEKGCHDQGCAASWPNCICLTCRRDTDTSYHDSCCSTVGHQCYDESCPVYLPECGE